MSSPVMLIEQASDDGADDDTAQVYSPSDTGHSPQICEAKRNQ